MSTAKVWKFGTGYAGISARGKRIFKKTKAAAEVAAGVKKRTSPGTRKTSSKGGGKRVSNKKSSPTLMGNLGFTGWLEAIGANIAGSYIARMYIAEDLRAASVGKILYGAQGHILNRRGKQFLPIGVIDLVSDVVMDWLETGKVPALMAPTGRKLVTSTQTSGASTWRYKTHKKPGESKAAFQARKRRAL